MEEKESELTLLRQEYERELKELKDTEEAYLTNVLDFEGVLSK
jgi:hypothetical protein